MNLLELLKEIYKGSIVTFVLLYFKNESKRKKIKNHIWEL